MSTTKLSSEDQGGGMKGKNLLIALALTILVFVPISGQCDPPKSPNDGWFLDEDAVVGVAASDPDEPGSYAEFKSDSLHVTAWLSATTNRAGDMSMATERGRAHLCRWPLIYLNS